jgi:hypothetical protein
LDERSAKRPLTQASALPTDGDRYFAKAWSKPTGKRESIRQADLHLEKALDLYNKETPGGLRVDLFEIGRGHEQLVDLSDEDKCLYYAKATAELTRQLALVKGDSYETDGKEFPLGPLRRDINKHPDAVRKKSAKTSCANTNQNG